MTPGPELARPRAGGPPLQPTLRSAPTRAGQRSRPVRRGFTLVEIMVAVAVLAVVLAIALPNLARMYMVANEGGVIEGMRAIVQACENYRIQGEQAGQFPADLRSLTGGTLPYLDERFRNVNGVFGNLWRGYRWTYQPGPLRAVQVGSRFFQLRDSFTLRADPVRRGFDGQRSFFTDHSGVIRYNTAGPAGPNDTPVGEE